VDLFDLTGKKALVTGAGSPQGLGRGMAQALKAAGAEVAILSRRERIFTVDVQGVAVFLASAASDYVHGAIIPVDGGYLVR
jgi:NAD(P)-dependent dehydrogenase (short-subunit alcohol dehydrogenase family)